MVQLRRTAANAAAYDLEARVLTPDEAGELWPPMRVDDLLGALWLPGDGKVNPTDLTQSLAKGARQGGARIREGVRVVGLLTERRARRAAGHRGPHRRRRRRGRGGRQLRRAVGQGRRGAGRRAADRAAAQRRALLRGHRARCPACTRTCRSCATRTAGPTSRRRSAAWWSAASSPTPSRGSPRTRSRTPSSSSCSRRTGSTSRCSWTRPWCGSPRWRRPGSASSTTGPRASRRTTSSCSASCRGCAASSSGRASTRSASRRPAARAGRWPSGSSPASRRATWSASTCAGSRPYAADNDWLRSRVAEVLGLHYAVPWPLHELRTGRDLRLSPLHDRLAAAGASFGSRMGWERPLRVRRRPGGRRRAETWERPPWLAASVAEQRACRTAVAVFDQTSFSKYAVRGPGALDGAAVDLRGRRRRGGRTPASTRRCSTAAAPTRPT